MKQNHHQVTRNSSTATKRSQAKKRESKPDSPIARSEEPRGLAPSGVQEDSPSGLCMKDRLRFSDAQITSKVVFCALSMSPLERLATAEELKKRVEADILAEFHPDGVGGYFSEAERFRIARMVLLSAKFLERMGICSEASDAVEIIQEFQHQETEYP